MKKFLLILTVALLCLTFVACSGTTQYLQLSLWRDYEYEKLTYSITEEGVNQKGELVMEMEEVQTADPNFAIPVINTETKLVENKVVGLEKNSFLLTRTHKFPAGNGLWDTMTNVTITDSAFNPLYSYAELSIAIEQNAYTGTGKAPTCFSYVTTSTYTKDATTSKWTALSSCLRQNEYGKTNHADWFFRTQTFKLENNTTDMNLFYYNIRFVNNLTETDDFKYQFSSPMVLESSMKPVNCTGKTEQIAVNDSVPYIYNEYKNIDASYGGFSLNLVKVSIFPMNQPVTGSGLTVYYSRIPILAKEELALVNSQNLLTKSEEIGSHRVPVIMIENSRPASSNTLHPDDRGTITYRLTDLTNVK